MLHDAELVEFLTACVENVRLDEHPLDDWTRARRIG
jgi:hypothetical protein